MAFFGRRSLKLAGVAAAGGVATCLAIAAGGIAHASSVVAVIQLEGDRPLALAMSEDGSRVYASHSSGAEYSSDGLPGLVSTIETATNRVVGPQIELSAYARSLVISPDGRSLYAASGDRPTLSAIDLETKQGRALPVAGGNSSAIAVDPAAGNLYLAQDDLLVVIDQATEEVTGQVRLHQWPTGVAVSPKGGRIFATSRNQKLSTILPEDIPNNSSNDVRTIAIQGEPQSVALSPDGETAYVPSLYLYQNFGKVAVVDTETYEVTTIDVGPSPDEVAVTPDGRYIVVGHSSDFISIIDAQTHEVEEVKTGFFPGDVVISPDGRYAYVSNYHEGTISVIAIGDREAEPEAPAASTFGSLREFLGS